MKKIIALLFFSIALIFLLVACSEEKNESKFIAKASDFEDSGFTSRKGQLIVVIGDELMISANYDPQSKEKSSIDKILESEQVKSGNHFLKNFKNVIISTKDDKYYISADDGVSLEFQKIGERIIVDEEGMEYYTQEYSKE